MTRLILTVCLLSLISCEDKQSNSKDLALADTNTAITLTCKKGPLEYSVFNKPDINKELYAVKFSIISESSDLHNLIIDIRLKNGGHFVSPNATRDFSGKFTMVIDKTDAFETVNKLVETPQSVEELDLHPFVNGPVNWVRENTIYTQQIKLHTENDFEAKGYIQFTIEPACTLEKIPFIIKQTDGVLKFEFFGC